MNSDTWQLIIGALCLVDAIYLVIKLRQNRDWSMLSAILPRVYLSFVYIYDGFVPRAHMEPMNTITFLGLALFFFTADANHFAREAWRHRK